MLYAVMTGDIVGSSRIIDEERQKLLDDLQMSFKEASDHCSKAIAAPFDIYRGDSFQGILSEPEYALRVSIMIRAALRHLFRTQLRRHALDARIAIGIGAVDYLPREKVLEGDGEAFRRSGPVLDDMKGNQQLRITTPWPEIDEEFVVSCGLLDAVIERWSAEQAGAVLNQLQGKTQELIAQKLGISQPAVVQRLKAAGGWAVEALCNRYEHLIKKALAGINK